MGKQCRSNCGMGLASRSETPSITFTAILDTIALPYVGRVSRSGAERGHAISGYKVSSCGKKTIWISEWKPASVYKKKSVIVLALGSRLLLPCLNRMSNRPLYYIMAMTMP